MSALIVPISSPRSTSMCESAAREDCANPPARAATSPALMAATPRKNSRLLSLITCLIASLNRGNCALNKPRGLLRYSETNDSGEGNGEDEPLGSFFQSHLTALPDRSKQVKSVRRS